MVLLVWFVMFALFVYSRRDPRGEVMCCCVVVFGFMMVGGVYVLGLEIERGIKSALANASWEEWK